MRSFLLFLIIFVSLFTTSAWAAGERDKGGAAPEEASAAMGEPAWWPSVLGLQYNLIAQSVSPFKSPYSGTKSLIATGDSAVTQTFGVYLGSQLSERLQAYVDFEMEKGTAIGNAVGLGGITNGDVIRSGAVDLGSDPYLARAFLRYSVPLTEATHKVERAVDRLPGSEADSRIDIKLGRFALIDDFDLNRYANNTRTQFMNYGFIWNTAWDYAADTRGFSNGVVAAWINPTWALRYGMFQMVSFANGNIFDGPMTEARGENLELTLQSNEDSTIVRILGFDNRGRMGSYSSALATAAATATTPNVNADERPGRVKYGYGINIEQPMADHGDTGAFLRYGWNDGTTESFMGTEVDRHFSLGFQISGIHWNRDKDVFGIGYVQHGLSPDHIAYLAAGGIGLFVGDGRLNYGPETIAEAYYRIQMGDVQVSPDIQYIQNPGYNQDRGPATIVSIRLHLEY